jgi:hypothetical protein
VHRVQHAAGDVGDNAYRKPTASSPATVMIVGVNAVPFQILVLYGSYRSDRKGIRLAHWICEEIRSRGDTAEFIDAKAFGLPIMDRVYKEYAPGRGGFTGLARFLHSTGQAHKGGPNTGVLQITTDHPRDVDPGVEGEFRCHRGGPGQRRF